MKSSFLICVVILAALSLSSGARPRPMRPPSAAPENVQSIDVVAKKYEFAPATIRVKQGTRVQLKI